MESKPHLWSGPFVAACFSSFFLFMTFYILSATLPLFVTEHLGGGYQQVGLVMTIFFIAAVIFRPLAGKWLDEYSRNKILFLSLALFLLCTAMYTVIPSLFALLTLRFIHGAGYGVAATATGTIAVELVPEKRKGEGVAYFTLFMSLAMVMGPFLGLLVFEHFNHLAIFGLCIIFSFLSLVCGKFMKSPECLHRPKREPGKGWRRFIEPGAVPISLAGSLLAFSYSTITTYISIYAKAIGIGSFASYFFVLFGAMIILSRPFIGKIYDRYGEHVLVYPSIFMFTAGMIGLSLAQTPVLFLAAGGVLGLGFGALFPILQVIAIQASSKQRRGLATGTFFLMFDFGFCMGSYILGLVASMTDYRTMYFVAGMTMICMTLIYYVLHHRRKVAVRNQLLVQPSVRLP